MISFSVVYFYDLPSVLKHVILIVEYNIGRTAVALTVVLKLISDAI